MNTEVIEIICQKLGTTAENVIPVAIEYGTRDNILGLGCGLISLIVGIFMLMVSLRLAKNKEFFDYDVPIILLFALGVIFILFGALVTFGCAYSLYFWIKYPELSAYRMILGWLK